MAFVAQVATESLLEVKEVFLMAMAVLLEARGVLLVAIYLEVEVFLNKSQLMGFCSYYNSGTVVFVRNKLSSNLTQI